MDIEMNARIYLNKIMANVPSFAGTDSRRRDTDDLKNEMLVYAMYRVPQAKSVLGGIFF